LLYCYAFYPSIGGIETITETLANNFHDLGHECHVGTEIPNSAPENFPFKVYRQYNLWKIYLLMRKVDIACTIELSMKYFIAAKLAGKPIIWVHNGYRLSCIDALGWYNNSPAPIDPWASVYFYIKKRGIFFALKEGLKMFGRRLASKYVTYNVAATKWIAFRQPLNNQVQLYTPYPIKKFSKIAGILHKKYDFIFLGRLVQEKGVETLLKAVKLLVHEPMQTPLKLGIVGYGSDEPLFISLRDKLELGAYVDFLGPKRGDDLLEIIKTSETAVVPSYWEEPMGGVSLELMAAGRNLIVSKNGGMPEVIGNAGLTFTNGDEKELFMCMKRLLGNVDLKKKQLEEGSNRVLQFSELILSKKYLQLFENAIAK